MPDIDDTEETLFSLLCDSVAMLFHGKGTKEAKDRLNHIRQPASAS